MQLLTLSVTCMITLTCRAIVMILWMAMSLLTLSVESAVSILLRWAPQCLRAVSVRPVCARTVLDLLSIRC